MLARGKYAQQKTTKMTKLGKDGLQRHLESVQRQEDTKPAKASESFIDTHGENETETALMDEEDYQLLCSSPTTLPSLSGPLPIRRDTRLFIDPPPRHIVFASSLPCTLANGGEGKGEWQCPIDGQPDLPRELSIIKHLQRQLVTTPGSYQGWSIEVTFFDTLTYPDLVNLAAVTSVLVVSSGRHSRDAAQMYPFMRPGAQVVMLMQQQQQPQQQTDNMLPEPFLRLCQEAWRWVADVLRRVGVGGRGKGVKERQVSGGVVFRGVMAGGGLGEIGEKDVWCKVKEAIDEVAKSSSKR
ncbi:unnamed protein product [Vitrella brassicaformis CCMP3155]|uniref:Uncharacterized protein n=1 Tax=Vitrella brassicaformis (strain CCMP3155) TaxID=1169540 RepID=A0A0G4GF53_VITBC|nr:unnamed protein product [Vitrella brassicaformis CCMP3155]|eukprot:CEM28146.1 unnamed protein product [Vitrella brassicaformis CCMP3155]